ncbi:MAG: S-layer protein [Gemmatales bacterium]|nr:MAG: S-layer protein [Gemmatales bacterium]
MASASSGRRTAASSLTSPAKRRFPTAANHIARVDAKGVVQAVGDGVTTIVARHNGQQVEIKVRVSGTQKPFTWSFRKHIVPLMTKAGCNSGACHGALAGKGGMKLSLRGYDPETDYFVLTRQALGRRVDRRHPERSLVLRKAALAMPHGGGRRLEIDSDDFRKLADWIAAGAPGPRPDDARVQRIEVLPRKATLKPGQSLQVLVRAWYSDGSVQDVTHWAKYQSSEELVAPVDDHGMVTVRGHGETAITVWYANLVAAARVLSPFPNKLDAEVFAKAPRTNYIDDLVLKKLEVLNLPPSPRCDDYEFIRRAYLDAAGILPTPEEVQRFVQDRSPNKRAKLIDDLLARSEYVDYWAYKWSDLLLVSSSRLSEPAVWSFYRFIRQSVADNKPWDRFARDIITAQGSTLENGAANYFVLHKEVTDLTESTAVAFLGMSITCARCHNHPLEKWTQDQYWEMANLFSRVGLKSNGPPGDITVQSKRTGDIFHPRRGRPMPPTPLDGRALPLESDVDRRQYFADWLTSPDNPFFAKALVNRVWRNFMGRGLVEAEDDLRETNPPTNAELFDALASDFIKNNYDVKRLIRTIMLSETYQRTSKPLPANADDDRFYSHYLVRRLSGEVILDAYSQVTGVPTRFDRIYTGVEGGTKNTNAFPEGTRALQLPDSRVASLFLDSFGRPEREQTCSCERDQDSSVRQALHLNNGDTLNDKLQSTKGRIERWLKENISDEEAVQRVFMLALCRPPTRSEAARFHRLLAEAAQDKTSTRRQRLEDIFWAVLTSKEFLFNH